MEKANKIDALKEILSGLGCKASLVPVSNLCSLSAMPDFKQARFLEICSGVPLDLLRSSDFVQSDEILELLRKGRFFFLENYSKDFGLLAVERPLALDEMLVLLALDGDGLIVYGADYSFVLALDFDLTGHVLELTYSRRER